MEGGGGRGVTKAVRAIMPTESKSSGLCIIKQTKVYGVILIYLRYTVKNALLRIAREEGGNEDSMCSEDVINKTLKSSKRDMANFGEDTNMAYLLTGRCA